MANANPTLDFKLNRELFRTAINAFARKHGPEAVDRAVRKMAFDTVAYTTKALNGAGAGYAHPKRIDTGRYRAAWSTAIEATVGRAGGPTTVTNGRAGVGRDEKGKFVGLNRNKAQPHDGTSKAEGKGLTKTITVTNNVEYGPYVEFGTDDMAAGLHLTRAMVVVAKDALKAVGIELSKAWDA